MQCRPAALALVLLAALTAGCAGAESPPGPTAAPLSVASPLPTEAVLPDVRGRGLREAQNTLRNAGFTHVVPKDARGEDREPSPAREWAVCTQAPEPGTAISVTTLVELGVVKLDEACPGAAGAAAPAAEEGR